MIRRAGLFVVVNFHFVSGKVLFKGLIWHQIFMSDLGKDLRQLSREGWNTGNGTPTHQDLNLGARLRIADALEKMVQPFMDLLDGIAYLRDREKTQIQIIKKMDRTIAALRGVIKRQKPKEKQHASKHQKK